MTVTIEPLHCGTLAAPRSSFKEGGDDETLVIPVPAWLIRHPKGIVLFDTGMHPDLASDTPFRELVSGFFEVGLHDERLVTAQLAARDVDPADVDIVVASHLHFDHTGGLAQIPDARVLIQRDEWEAGVDDDLAAANFFRREEYDLGHDRVLLDGAHDVFDDGTVICLPTPGHTPGHQSLVLRTAEREVVLCGDCAYFESTLAGGPLPPIGHDRKLQQRSIKTLRARKDDGALVIPGHDPVTFATLPDRIT